MSVLKALIKAALRLAFDLRSWIAGMKALRIPSLVIAAFSCSLGIVLAWRAGRGDLLNAAAVLVAGLALQAGVNLVNDFFEFRQRRVDDKIANLGFGAEDRELLEWLIFLVGLACFGIAGLIGLFLAWRSGWQLIPLGIVGFVGGFFYTGEPLNYKRRGLAVALVFFLMGVFMVAGSAFAVSGAFSWHDVLASLPVSILVSLILLANELRDFESDTRHGIRTLAVRIGFKTAKRLFVALIAAAYGCAAALRLAGEAPRVWPVFLALPFAALPLRFLSKPPEQRSPIIPFVMLHHLAFGALYCAAWYLP
jgi:1,4-dihydroxy-2-naphthoate octaprenyltransferase